MCTLSLGLSTHTGTADSFLGCEGRWCLGCLQKFPCLPQVPEVPIWPSGQGPVSEWAASKLLVRL